MKNIDDEIEETLTSLQGARRATPSDSFDDDLQRRLSFLPPENGWLQWLRYGVAAMIILGLVNLFALTRLSQTNTAEDFTSEIATEFFDSPDYFFESIE